MFYVTVRHFVRTTLGSLFLLTSATGLANAACPPGSTIMSNFPYYITEPGTYCMAAHTYVNPTSNSAWGAITIAASNVTVDLGRWELRGPGFFADAVSGYGVQITNNASDVTIRNGTIAGFNSGIVMWTNSGSNSVERLTIEDMQLRALGYAAVNVSLNSTCTDCTIQNNQISNIDANRVQNQGGYSGAFGVRFDDSSDIKVLNNTITGVHSRGPMPSYGVYLLYSSGALVKDNRISDIYGSATNDTGILAFGTSNMDAIDNRISYFYYGIRYAYSSGGHSGNTFYMVTKPITGGTPL